MGDDMQFGVDFERGEKVDDYEGFWILSWSYIGVPEQYEWPSHLISLSDAGKEVESNSLTYVGRTYSSSLKPSVDH